MNDNRILIIVKYLYDIVRTALNGIEKQSDNIVTLFNIVKLLERKVDELERNK